MQVLLSTPFEAPRRIASLTFHTVLLKSVAVNIYVKDNDVSKITRLSHWLSAEAPLVPLVATMER